MKNIETIESRKFNSALLDKSDAINNGFVIAHYGGGKLLRVDEIKPENFNDTFRGVPTGTYQKNGSIVLNLERKPIDEPFYR